MTKVRGLLLVLLLVTLGGGRLVAHPHVWVQASLALVMQDGKVTALDVVWKFDDFYSALARDDFDKDRDRVLSQQERDALVGVSALTLAESSFFTHLKIGDERPHVPLVQEFYIDDDGANLTYRFRVPMTKPVDPTKTPFAVGLFDSGYYVDIDLAETRITVPDSSCRMVPKEALDEPLYYGLFFPTYYHLVCGTA